MKCRALFTRFGQCRDPVRARLDIWLEQSGGSKFNLSNSYPRRSMELTTFNANQSTGARSRRSRRSRQGSATLAAALAALAGIFFSANGGAAEPNMLKNARFAANVAMIERLADCRG